MQELLTILFTLKSLHYISQHIFFVYSLNFLEFQCCIDILYSFSLQDKISSKGTDGGKVMQYQLGDIESTVKLEKAVSELQTQVEELKEERDNAKEKLAAHDAAAKRAITALQKEMSAREEQVSIICNYF